VIWFDPEAGVLNGDLVPLVLYLIQGDLDMSLVGELGGVA